MNDQPPLRVSVIDPISQAIDTVKMMLFSPFDLPKWLIVGFCAWLATLGQGNRFNFNYSDDYNAQEVQPFKPLVMNHLPIFIGIGVAIALIVIILLFVFLWLRSRGKFMFLHCIAHNVAEVKNPWSIYSTEGNSLFLFSIVLSLAGFLAIGTVVGGTVAGAVAFYRTAPGPVPMILTIVAGTLLALPLMIVFGLAVKFTKDFVVPLMALRACSVTEAWSEFADLLKAHPEKFTVYILFQIVLGAAIGFIVLAIFCASCLTCIVAILLALPYVGTVILLPIITFSRAYSLHYLQQYGPGYDVFLLPYPVQTTAEDVQPDKLD